MPSLKYVWGSGNAKCMDVYEEERKVKRFIFLSKKEFYSLSFSRQITSSKCFVLACEDYEFLLT